MSHRVLKALISSILLSVSLVCVGADMTLKVDQSTIVRLEQLREESKFLDLPGAPAAEERSRLEPLINSLLDRLIAGIRTHPTSGWVVEQMDPTVEAFHLEDTEARERCIEYLDRTFRILGIPNDGGAFRKYMIIW